jgi:uncharacterized membrane protein YqjE
MAVDFSARLGARLQRVADLLLSLLQVRLELLGIELQQEVLRLFDAVARAALAMLLLAFGLFFAVSLLVVLLWDGYRLWALGCAALLFLGGGAWLLRDARTRLQPSSHGSFATSVDELAKDRAQVGAPAP